MGNEVNGVINNLCEKLGYAASELTPEMAKYMIAKDTVVAVACLIFIAIGILAIYSAYKHYKKEAEDARSYDDGFSEAAIIAISAVLTLFCVVVLVCTATDLVGWIVSPKASTVQYILEAI